MSDRRTFIRGLVSLPLIGGGVTLIGRPAAAVPLVQAAALPTFDDPRQRARYAWEAFSAAMRDVTSGADGWSVMGGERVTPIPHYSLEVGGHVLPKAIHYVYEPRQDPNRPFVYERAAEVVMSAASQGGRRKRATGGGDRTTAGGGSPEAVAVEARDIVRQAAGDVTGKTVAAQVRQAARHLGYPAESWRVREAWYGRAGRWSAAAVDDLRRRFTAWHGREAIAPSSLAQRVMAVRRLLVELERQVTALEVEVEVCGSAVGGRLTGGGSAS